MRPELQECFPLWLLLMTSHESSFPAIPPFLAECTREKAPPHTVKSREEVPITTTQIPLLWMLLGHPKQWVPVVVGRLSSQPLLQSRDREEHFWAVWPPLIVALDAFAGSSKAKGPGGSSRQLLLFPASREKECVCVGGALTDSAAFLCQREAEVCQPPSCPLPLLSPATTVVGLQKGRSFPGVPQAPPAEGARKDCTGPGFSRQ